MLPSVTDWAAGGVVICGGCLPVMLPVRVPLLLTVPLPSLVRLPPSSMVTVPLLSMVPLLVSFLPSGTVRDAPAGMVRVSPSSISKSSCKVTLPYTVPVLLSGLLLKAMPSPVMGDA